MITKTPTYHDVNGQQVPKDQRAYTLYGDLRCWPTGKHEMRQEDGSFRELVSQRKRKKVST